MQVSYLFLAMVAVVIPNCMGKTFSRCELAVELVAQGFSQDEINDWVCLVERESGRNTSVRGGPNRNGSYDYGLFQINGKWWCSLGSPGGDCNMKCEDLLDDDITDDARCAKKIYRRHGFFAWNGWKSKCKNKTLPDIHYCLQ